MIVKQVDYFGGISIEFGMNMKVPPNATCEIYDQMFEINVWSILDNSFIKGTFCNETETRKLSIAEDS